MFFRKLHMFIFKQFLIIFIHAFTVYIIFVIDTSIPFFKTTNFKFIYIQHSIQTVINAKSKFKIIIFEHLKKNIYGLLLFSEIFYNAN